MTDTAGLLKEACADGLSIKERKGIVAQLVPSVGSDYDDYRIQAVEALVTLCRKYKSPRSVVADDKYNSDFERGSQMFEGSRVRLRTDCDELLLRWIEALSGGQGLASHFLGQKFSLTVLPSFCRWLSHNNVRVRLASLKGIDMLADADDKEVWMYVAENANVPLQRMLTAPADDLKQRALELLWNVSFHEPTGDRVLTPSLLNACHCLLVHPTDRIRECTVAVLANLCIDGHGAEARKDAIVEAGVLPLIIHNLRFDDDDDYAEEDSFKKVRTEAIRFMEDTVDLDLSIGWRECLFAADAWNPMVEVLRRSSSQRAFGNACDILERMAGISTKALWTFGDSSGSDDSSPDDGDDGSSVNNEPKEDDDAATSGDEDDGDDEDDEDDAADDDGDESSADGDSDDGDDEDAAPPLQRGELDPRLNRRIGEHATQLITVVSEMRRSGIKNVAKAATERVEAMNTLWDRLVNCDDD